MLHIGYHESSSGGYVAMGEEAVSVGADTFAFFTRNPRGGKAKDIDPKDAADFCRFAAGKGFAKLVAHAPYTMSPCSADEGLRQYAKEMMIDDLRRMKYTPGNLYNFHPGSHVQQGAEIGIDLTAKMLGEVIKTGIQEGTLPCTTILIETMSGKGSEIGRTFEEVRLIREKAAEYAGQNVDEYLGVCLDTCHVWDGGYDIVNNLDGVVSQFDKIVGLQHLKAIHLNDSMNPMDSHKDRHQKIGQGYIGFDALVRVINHDALRELPFILETPNEKAGYAEEILRLKEAFKG